jgi:hypothetical protein
MAKAKLPKEIHLSYFKIEVKYLNTLIAQEIGEQQGSFHARDLVIYVDEEIIELGGNRAVSLVIHELFHAIYYDKSLTGAEEERTVNSFANGTVELLTRNPQLSKWINENI